MHTPTNTAVKRVRTHEMLDAGSPAPGFPALAVLSDRIDVLIDSDRPRLRRLWMYFRNPLSIASAVIAGDDNASSGRPYRQAQEWGLPARITGVRAGSDPMQATGASEGPARKEIVIENDIGWRVETMVDYLFGKPLVITSAAVDPVRREAISELLRLILAQNGGILFLQQLALLGSVYGFVDVLVKLEPGSARDMEEPATACDERSRIESRGSRTQAMSSGKNETHCGIQQLGQPPARLNGLTSDGAGPSTGSSGSDDARALGAPEGLPQAGPASGDDAASGASTSESNAGASHPSPEALSPCPATTSVIDAAQLARLARRIRLEVVEPARALPFLSSMDYRVVDAYAQCFDVGKEGTAERGQGTEKRLNWFERLVYRTGRAAQHLAEVRRTALSPDPADNSSTRIIELITPTHWRRYENSKITSEGANSLGEIPLVHIQNTAVPFEYGGASDVEPLLPMQDELNTRLSDRAHRITMQSFRMYLGKGIEDFTSLPVAPGRMWMTDNDQAEVIEFGGDASCPSEDAHIADLREAMDKASGVSPIAAGAIKGRIGRLTSAAALRVTMQALLAKTDKKRTTYGTGIARMCELALAWLDRAGLFATTPEERRVELNWPSPLPENELEKLQEAEAKVRLGVSREIVLRELGY